MRHVLVFALGVAVAGCVSDPRDPNTWIKKLDSPVDQKDAVRELVRLKDPVAVEPLINFYKKNHDPEVLKAIATFKDKRQVPVMIDSLEYTDESYDNAATAAAALGDTPDPSAVEPLVKALQKPLSIKTRANIVKQSAMESLAKIHDPKATPAIAKILETPADEQDFFLLAKGISEAMNCTAFGLITAVPALLAFSILNGWTQTILDDINEVSVQVVNMVVGHRNAMKAA